MTPPCKNCILYEACMNQFNGSTIDTLVRLILGCSLLQDYLKDGVRTSNPCIYYEPSKLKYYYFNSMKLNGIRMFYKWPPYKWVNPQTPYYISKQKEKDIYEYRTTTLR